ncbi:MAG: glycosyltransferase [Roseitalea sp.]|nr:glycosyltransferase [Roseitalea sp.]MBO6950911.1 glycosyltransferase [Rhizobiaceae bacterium]MBO6591102.1 glycosyltransferase [Roseitalea sp.]MBO6599640.1 glycosyltransferase [Roseitalea sp.]MBO6613891.1 glycosyltransferase [Roseitalea sp.]
MDSSSIFGRVVDAYAQEGYPHSLIGQWTLPENDVADLVANVSTEKPKNILEVGTFVGLSTMILALCTDDDTHIVTVDPNLPLQSEMGSMGSELGDIDASVGTLAIAERVARRLGIDDRITFVEGGFSSSATFSSRRRFPTLSIPIVGPETCRAHGPFDLIFVDGLHYADVVESDLELAHRSLTDKGVILMHDCVGMWGTNVRSGIGRFLDGAPEWNFTHHPYTYLYRSVGTVFRPDHRPDLAGILLEQPNVTEQVRSGLGPLATSLVKHIRPTSVLEVTAGRDILGPFFEPLATVQTVDLMSAGTTGVASALNDLIGGSESVLVVSAGVPDLLGEEDLLSLFRSIVDAGAMAAFLRTPPGERGSACRFSRPLQSWLRLAERSGASLHQTSAMDLAPSRFLFKRGVDGAGISTSLCHDILLVPEVLKPSMAAGFPPIEQNAVDTVEQDATLQTHYAAAFHSLLSQNDAAVSAQASSMEYIEHLKATIAGNSENTSKLKAELKNLEQRKIAARNAAINARRLIRDRNRQLALVNAANRFWQAIAGDLSNGELPVDRRAAARRSVRVSSAVAHATADGITDGVGIAFDSMPSLGELAAVLLRSDTLSVCVPERAASPDLDMLDETRIGGGRGQAAWQMPSGIKRLYSLGGLRGLSRPMLEGAWRAGLNNVFIRVGGRWIGVPLGVLHRGFVAGGKGRDRVREARDRVLVAARKTAPALNALGPTTEEAFGQIASAGCPNESFVSGRVVHVCGSLAPGGAERQCANTLIGLAETGTAMPMLLAHFLNPGPQRCDFHLARVRNAGVEAREIEKVTSDLSDRHVPRVLRNVGSAIPENVLLDIANLVREFERLMPEVVHCWLDWDNVRAGLAAVLAGVPKVIVSGRNLAPTNFKLYQSYMDPAYRALATLPQVQFINNSRAGADSYADWIGIDRERVGVVHNGFDPSSLPQLDRHVRDRVRESLAIDADDFVVGGVFRFEEEKRPLLWVDAALLAAKDLPNARFVLYGQGSYREALERRIAESAHADRFVLAGVTDEPVAAMAAMDVFMLTSFGEGLPNVLIEAQAAGTPVITTPAGGAPETMEPGVTGWLCEGDPAELAKQIVSAYQSGEVRAKVRQAGPRLVRDRFGIDRMIDETMQLYQLSERTRSEHGTTA